MFIRKRYNKSGSFSIQIVEKKGDSLRIIKHIGTASATDEIEYLLLVAKTKLNKIQGQLSLFNKKETSPINNWMNRLNKPKYKWVGFHEVFGYVFDLINYQSVFSNALLKDLVVARIVHPESKLSIHRWLQRKLHRNITKDNIYRFMDTLDKDVEQKVSDHTYRFIQNILNEKIHIIFFDATTLHFETFNKDSFRLPGFSKVGKHNQPQIVIGLMVTKEGLPIGYDIYPGNEFDGHTIRSALRRVARRYGVEKVVFVADSAMLSKDNIEIIEKSGFQFIMAARIKSMSNEYKLRIQNLDNYTNNILDIKYGSHRLIVSYSEDRARKDRHDRDKNLEQIKKRIGKTNDRKLVESSKITKTKVGKIGKSKYLEVLGDAEVAINYEAVRNDSKWDGLKGYVTNITNHELSSSEVIQKYVQLWQVERAFRIAKNDLNMRPIYHFKRERIRAHILLVFMSLVVSRYTEYLLKDLNISTKYLVEMLDTIIETELVDQKTGVKLIIRPEFSELIKKVYQKLGIVIHTGVKTTL